MRDEHGKFFPPLRELPYIDGKGKRQLQWAQEQSLDDLSEAPETDADEAEDASSPFSKDDSEKGSNWPTNRS